MAVCTAPVAYYLCAMASGTGCSSWVVKTTFIRDPSNTDPLSCPGPVLLSSSELSSFQSVTANFGWDVDAFEIAVGGALGMFAVGFGIGLIIQNLRRLRTP